MKKKLQISNNHNIIRAFIIAGLAVLLTAKPATCKVLSAEDYISVAAKQFAEGQAVLARTNYAKAQSIDDENPYIYLGVGQYSYLYDNYSRAKLLYKKAIELEKDERPQSYMLLGQTNLAEGLLSYAKSNFKKAEKLNKGSELPIIALASINSAGNWINLADNYYNKAIELNPKNPMLLASLGTRFAKKKDYVAAENFYTNAVMLDPNASHIIGLGLIYAIQGKTDGAISCFEKVISVKKDFTNDFINLVNAKGRNTVYKKAIKTVEKLQQKEPEDQNYDLLLGYLHYGQHDYQNAIKHFELVDNDSAKNGLAIVYYKLAMIAYSAGKQELKEIEFAFKKALSYEPDFVEPYLYLATLYYEGEEYSLAEEYAEKAVDINPKFALSYYLLGNIYRKEKDYSFARVNYEKFNKHCPYWPDVYYKLAKMSKEELKKDNEKKLTYELVAAEKAPEELHDLVKLNEKDNPGIYEDIHELIDYIWSDKEGKILLGRILEYKIPIQVLEKGYMSYFHLYMGGYKLGGHTRYGYIPVRNLYSYSDLNIFLNQRHIKSISDSNVPYEEKVRSIEVFVHELCHAVQFTVNKEPENSMLEELTSSMIGYNVASRILTGKELTEMEVIDYSQESLLYLLLDDHRKLPVTSDFLEDISSIGIIPPMPDLYKNIVGLHTKVQKDLNASIPPLSNKFMIYGNDIHKAH